MKNYPTALITGASSGIGYCFAKQLAEDGKYNLLILARREDRLKDLKEEIEKIWEERTDAPRVNYYVVDLVNKEERNQFINLLQENQLNVDLLINNAGFGSVKNFADSDISRQLDMLELNVGAAMHLCHAVLPHMKQQKSGVIVNVCSTASFQPMPYMATYGGTKSFLRNFSIALNSELKKYNILVMAHCPGPTESEFHIAAGLEDKIANLPGMTSEQVAKETLSAIKSRKVVVVNGLSNKVTACIASLLPLQVSSALVERILRKHGS